MRRLLLTIWFLLLAISASGAEYYASPSGSGTACSLASPCSLEFIIGDSSPVGAGDNANLRGGTYTGKFRSTLTGGTVRSYAGEWAKIDGHLQTTLVGAMDDTQTSFTVANGAGFATFASDEISIGVEVLKFCTRSGNTFSGCTRGASGSTSGGDPHADGDPVILGGAIFYVAGDSTTYRDFEITSSEWTRDAAVTTQGHSRGNAVFVVGDSNNFINMLIRNGLIGFFSSSVSSNTLYYGNVLTNNGAYHTPSDEEGLGMSFYLENSAGYSRIYENIGLNSFNQGAQFYGVTGAFVGGDCNGTVLANSGAPMRSLNTGWYTHNLIYGTDSVTSATGSVTNSHFFHNHGTSASQVNFGYGAGITTGTFTGNYIVGGQNLFEATSTLVNLTATGNTLYSTGFAQYTIAPSSGTGGWTWNNNTYHDAGGRTVFGVNGVGLMNFATWKTTTGFDTSSTETSVDMPDTVVVRPNSYETGRANVVVYAPSAPSSINVDLSTTGLTNGQSYEIRNAFDWDGGLVATGTYNSGSPTVSVSLTGNALNVETVVGMAYTPPTTCPNFCVFVVKPTSAAAGASCKYFFSKPTGCA